MNTPSVPFRDRWGARLGPTAGGTAPVHRGRSVAALEMVTARAPAQTFDGGLHREHMPWFKRPAMTPPGQGGYVDWTGAGPIRASLHMRDVTINRAQGTDNTRAQDPVPTGYGIQSGTGESMRRQLGPDYGRPEVPINTTPHGLHSRSVKKRLTGIRRSQLTPQMQPARQNRLRPSPYVGQSFSQTTTVQGS
jgi:hypothetical protein